jgi:hypothetical protein
LALVLFAVREPTADAWTPAELVAAARATGWGRVAFTAARVGLVAALLVLVEACKLAGHMFAAAGDLFAVLATVAAVAGVRPLLTARTA